MSEALQAADILIGIIIIALGFVYRTMAQRTDKLEETSRRDDVTLKEMIKDSRSILEREMEMRRTDIISLHSKVEKNEEKCNVYGERISRLEGIKNG